MEQPIPVLVDVSNELIQPTQEESPSVEQVVAAPVELGQPIVTEPIVFEKAVTDSGKITPKFLGNPFMEDAIFMVLPPEQCSFTVDNASTTI